LWAGFSLLVAALAILISIPFISAIFEGGGPKPRPLPLSSRSEASLNPAELRAFLIEKLGEQTSYGHPRISMVKVGGDLSLDLRNATREVLGQVDFSRFAVVRIALELEDRQAQKSKVFEDLAAIYSTIFRRFEALDGLLIFIEAPLPGAGGDGEGKEELKSVALAYMTRATAGGIDWTNIPLEELPSICDYFEWIHPDLR